MADLIRLLHRLLRQSRSSTGRVAAFAGRGTRGLHYLWHLLIWSRISAGRSGLLPIELPPEVRHALQQSTPDIVELGSFFVEPWAAFRYRDECRQHDRRCLVSAYFHTDIAHAYVGAPLRHLLVDGVEEISETLAAWGNRVSEVIENGAEASFGPGSRDGRRLTKLTMRKQSQ